MSTTPSRPNAKPPVDEETRRIIEQRLATADEEPKQDARKAVEEIGATFTIHLPGEAG